MKKNVKITLMTIALLSLTSMYGSQADTDINYEGMNQDATEALGTIAADLDATYAMTFDHVMKNNQQLTSQEVVARTNKDKWAALWEDNQKDVEKYIEDNGNRDTKKMAKESLGAFHTILAGMKHPQHSKHLIQGLRNRINTANTKLYPMIEDIKNSSYNPLKTKENRYAAELLLDWNIKMLKVLKQLSNEMNA